MTEQNVIESESPTQSPVEEKPQVPKELQEKVAAVAALAQTHQLLNVGHFQVANSGRLVQSLQFITMLHAQMLNEAKSHPEALLVDELKALIEGEKHGQSQN